MDVDDVLQETLLATLGYIRKNGGFEGDRRRLAVTIAQNRCRDILRWRKARPNVPLVSLENWIADKTKNPLDTLAEQEVLSILQSVLNNLGVRCRNLLQDLYLRHLSMDEIRHKAGLKSVQAIYYRRTICLKEARKLLNCRLEGRSPDDEVVSHPMDADSEVQYE